MGINVYNYFENMKMEKVIIVTVLRSSSKVNPTHGTLVQEHFKIK